MLRCAECNEYITSDLEFTDEDTGEIFCETCWNDRVKAAIENGDEDWLYLNNIQLDEEE